MKYLLKIEYKSKRVIWKFLIHIYYEHVYIKSKLVLGIRTFTGTMIVSTFTPFKQFFNCLNDAAKTSKS